jgi:hypothetical protein
LEQTIIPLLRIEWGDTKVIPSVNLKIWYYSLRFELFSLIFAEQVKNGSDPTTYNEHVPSVDREK